VFIFLKVITGIFIVSFLLKFLIKLVSNSFSKNWRQEITPFECGFDLSSTLNIPFSLIYFILTLIFLLFDLELIYLIFLRFLQFNKSLLSLKICIYVFIFFLLLRFLYEWIKGALNWEY